MGTQSLPAAPQPPAAGTYVSSPRSRSGAGPSTAAAAATCATWRACSSRASCATWRSRCCALAAPRWRWPLTKRCCRWVLRVGTAGGYCGGCCRWVLQVGAAGRALPAGPCTCHLARAGGRRAAAERAAAWRPKRASAAHAAPCPPARPPGLPCRMACCRPPCRPACCRPCRSSSPPSRCRCS